MQFNFSLAGNKKRKEQLDANQTAANVNYAGAYGVAPPVSFSFTCLLFPSPCDIAPIH